MRLQKEQGLGTFKKRRRPRSGTLFLKNGGRKHNKISKMDTTWISREDLALGTWQTERDIEKDGWGSPLLKPSLDLIGCPGASKLDRENSKSASEEVRIS
jgi:hypothetical protein